MENVDTIPSVELDRRTTKEYDVIDGNNPEIKTRFGTLDKNNPSVIYIRAKARVTPTEKKTRYTNDVQRIKQRFIEETKELVSRYGSDFDGRHLCSMDLSDNCLFHGKKSYMRYDIYLKPVTRKESLKEHTETMEGLVHTINDGLRKTLSENGMKLLNA